MKIEKVDAPPLFALSGLTLEEINHVEFVLHWASLGQHLNSPGNQRMARDIATRIRSAQGPVEETRP